jgi:DNA-binding response OmpR family regulator
MQNENRLWGEIHPRFWQKVFEFGRSDVLNSPVNEDELLGRVNAIIQRARIKNESADMLQRQTSRLHMALLVSRMVAVEWDIATVTAE